MNVRLFLGKGTDRLSEQDEMDQEVTLVLIMDQEKWECQIAAGTSSLGGESMNGERQENGSQGHKSPYQLTRPLGLLL